MFLEYLVKRFDEGFISDNLTKRKFRPGEFIYGSRDIIIQNYKRFNDSSSLSDDRICESLSKYGWEYKKIRVGKSTPWVYIIEYEKFRQFRKEIDEDVGEVDDDFCIEEEDNNEE